MTVPQPATMTRIVALIGIIVFPRVLRDIGPDSRLTEDLGLDSMARVCLGGDCEDDFGVELPDEDIATCETVGDVALAIDRLRTSAPA